MTKRFAVTLSVILAVSTVRTVCASGIDFDQNMDVEKITEQIRGIEVDGGNIPTVSDPTEVDLSRIGGRTYTEDCVRFSFVRDEALLSEAVWLKSDEYREDCHTDSNGRRRCNNQYVRSYRGKAQILIRERELFPWEKELFEVCLKGPWMDIYGIAMAYKYNVDSENTVQYELIPGEKVPMNPDKEGLTLESFVFDPAIENFVMKVSDKWADSYAGEQTEITVELKRDVALWFDHTVLKKKITFDAAAEYEIHFVDLIGDFTENLKNAKYYVNWGFKRKGEISKDKYQKKGETEKVEISPAKS